LRRKFFFHCRVATVSYDSIWYALRKRGEFLRFRGIQGMRASAYKNAKHVDESFRWRQHRSTLFLHSMRYDLTVPRSSI
jgi:hypothetical protein